MVNINKAALDEAVRLRADGRMSRDRLLAAASRHRLPTGDALLAAAAKHASPANFMRGMPQRTQAEIVLRQAEARARLIASAARAFA